MPLYIKNGSSALLLDAGSLAGSADCCCGGAEVTCTIAVSATNQETGLAAASGYYAINFKGVVVSGPSIKAHSLSGIATDSDVYSPSTSDTGWQSVEVLYGTTGTQACITFTTDDDATHQCCVDIPCCYQVNDVVLEIASLPATFSQECIYSGFGGEIEYTLDGLNAYNGTTLFDLVAPRGPCDTQPALVLDSAYQFSVRRDANTATYEGALTAYADTVVELLSVPNATRISGSASLPASMYLRVADKTGPSSECLNTAECGVTPVDPCGADLKVRSTTNGITLLLEFGLGSPVGGAGCSGTTFTYKQPYYA